MRGMRDRDSSPFTLLPFYRFTTLPLYHLEFPTLYPAARQNDKTKLIKNFNLINH